jgi:large subunit ribosomal protein L17
MLRNLARGLVEHGRIKTTLARAKRLRPFIEKVVTRLKDPNVANMRLAYAELNDRPAVLKIASEIAPKFKTRPGGYTRIYKLAGHRPGDAAEMALIEWVDEALVGVYQETAVPKSAKKTTKASAGSKAAKKASAAKPKKAKKSDS